MAFDSVMRCLLKYNFIVNSKNCVGEEDRVDDEVAPTQLGRTTSKHRL